MKLLTRLLFTLCFATPALAQAALPAELAAKLAAAGRFSTYLSLQEIAGATQGQRVALPKGAAVAGATQGQRFVLPKGAAVAGATQGQVPSASTVSATQGQVPSASTVSATQGQVPSPAAAVSATQGQRTWLAPNDAAFARMAPEELAALKSNPARARAFLALHTLPAHVAVADMFANVQNSYKSFESTEGHVLGFQCDGHTGAHHPRVSADAAMTRAAEARAKPVAFAAAKAAAAAAVRTLADFQPQARIGELQDLAAEEGLVHELDGLLSTGDQPR